MTEYAISSACDLIFDAFQITGVTNRPSWIASGSTSRRSRMYTTTADTASVTPIVNISSTTSSSGT